MDRSDDNALLRAEAEQAFAKEDYERAAELFHDIAQDPADTDAAFFAAVAYAMQDGAEYRRIAQVGEAAEPAIRKTAERLGTGEAYYAACRTIVSAVIDVTSLHYEAVSDYCKKERKKRRRAAEDLSGAESLLRDCVLTVDGAAKTHVKDDFGFEMIGQGKFTTAQIDRNTWTEEMLDMLVEWINTDPRGEKYRGLDWSKEYDLAHNGDPTDTQTAL